VERVPEAGSSAEAAIVLEEAVDADVAPAPPDVPAVLAPVATEAAAISVGERPVAADAETAEASALGASEEGGVETRFVPPSGSLVAVRRSSEGRRQLLRFRTREASDPFFEATVGSLRSSLEIFCRDVPKILQVTVSGIPFFCDQGVFCDAPLPSLRI
jgi:hypothetical protein